MDRELYYIIKRGAYYGPDYKGYTTDFIYAGNYSKEEAEMACRLCAELTMKPVNKEEHNAEVDRRISELRDQKFLIQ
jgi:hypothetical protein